MHHCEPANSIIIALGGIRPVAVAADTTETTVRRWRLPVESGGTGGFIPRKKHAALLNLAEKVGVDLTSAAFLDTDFAPAKEAAA